MRMVVMMIMNDLLTQAEIRLWLFQARKLCVEPSLFLQVLINILIETEPVFISPQSKMVSPHIN